MAFHSVYKSWKIDYTPTFYVGPAWRAVSMYGEVMTANELSILKEGIANYEESGSSVLGAELVRDDTGEWHRP